MMQKQKKERSHVSQIAPKQVRCSPKTCARKRVNISPVHDAKTRKMKFSHHFGTKSTQTSENVTCFWTCEVQKQVKMNHVQKKKTGETCSKRNVCANKNRICTSRSHPPKSYKKSQFRRRTWGLTEIRPKPPTGENPPPPQNWKTFFHKESPHFGDWRCKITQRGAYLSATPCMRRTRRRKDVSFTTVTSRISKVSKSLQRMVKIFLVQPLQKWSF